LNIIKVEQLIKENQWSNASFCKFFGMSHSWITDMKNGKGIPNDNDAIIKLIADRLNASVDYLTDKTDIKNKPTAQGDELIEKKQKLINIMGKLSEENQDKILELAQMYIDAEQHLKDNK
jgi:transcriptional regulator with XRE-family HTH domain